jgi:hypothetical protein
MILVQVNAGGQEIAAPMTLDQKGLRLPQVLSRLVDKTRPFMVAIRRRQDFDTPLNELWVPRGWKVAPVKDDAGKVVTPGIVNPWPRRYLPKDCSIVIVYLPLGGGGAAGGGSRSKSPLAVVAGIAGLALAAFAGPLAGLLAPTLAGALGVSAGVATFIAQGAFVIGGTALLAFSSKSRATKTATDTRELYGVSGGGNLPKPGETIPRVYGRPWIKPDLSQPDFSKYDGDEQILYKRMTLTVGQGRVYTIRAGKQVMWTLEGGWVAPFNDGRNQVEFIYGTASKLVPSNVISATGVGGTLPRVGENPSIAGPFPINQRGALISKIEISFQFPNGISRQTTLKSKTVLSNQPAPWAVYFQYAPIDESGALTGPWQVLYNGNSGAEGARFGTKPMRYTKSIDVPPGRYAVQGFNVQPDTSDHDGTGDRIIDAAQWDSAVGYVADVAVRPGITECCMTLTAGKGNQAAAFGEIELEVQAIIPVWTGSDWIDQETRKAAWAFCDILRDSDYGAGMSEESMIGARDLAAFYDQRITEFDTFDDTIRGPVSVYEAGATVLLPFRAEPVYLGRYWSFVRDEPRAVRKHLLLPHQITASSTKETFDLDTDSGKHHVIGEFNEDGDYRTPNQSQAIYGEASRTPVRQRWTGVSSYEHALHLTRWRAAVGAYRNLTKEVGVELEGRIYKRGDSISIPSWFLEETKAAQVVDAHGYRIGLDWAVPLAANDQIVFRDRTGREWGPIPIVGPGDYPEELILSPADVDRMEMQTGMSFSDVLSDGDTEMTSVSIGQVAYLSESYLVKSVSMTDEDRATVSVVYDAPEVFAAIGAPVINPPAGSAGLSDPLVPKILAFTAVRVQMAAGFICQYAITAGRGCAGFDVEISYDGGNHYEPVQDNSTATSGAFALNPVDPMKVLLRARPYGPTGLPGLWFYAELDLPQSELGVDLPVIQYEDLDKRITDQLAKVDQIQQQAQDAVNEALERLDLVRQALAEDPAIRQGYIDPIIGDIRGSFDKLDDSIKKNLEDLDRLKDGLRTAGIDVNEEDGSVRLYALERLETDLGSQITNLGVSLDSLEGKVSLYASKQEEDLAGVVQKITTVQSNLDAIQGTITDSVTQAVLNGELGSRLSNAESTISAQGITLAASQATLDDQSLRLTTAEQQINAVTGEITQTIRSTNANLQLDVDLLPQTLAGFMAFINEQSGRLNQQFAYATTNMAANFDEAGRATATLRTELLVYKDGASAQFLSITRAVADANSALVTQTTALQAGIRDAQAQVVNEAQARSNQDSALGQQISSTNATVAANTATITSVDRASVDRDSALGQRIDAFNARVGNAEASISNEGAVRASQDSALGQQIANTNARTDQVSAAVSNEATARAQGDNATASQVNDLYARSDIGTAYGRFAMTAVAAPSGVSVRLAAQVSTDSYGVRRNAGYFLDLLPDGTSRFLIDANFFAITANGGVSYPFTFDGTTLRVPNLILTGSNVPPGVANTPARFDAYNYTLIAGQGSVFQSVDPNMVATLNVENDLFPTIITIRGKFSLNASTTIGSMGLLVDGRKVAPVIVYGDTSGVLGLQASTQANGGQSFSFQATTIEFLGPGTHQIRFVFNYTGVNGSGVLMNEIHMAAVTARA